MICAISRCPRGRRTARVSPTACRLFELAPRSGRSRVTSRRCGAGRHGARRATKERDAEQGSFDVGAGLRPRGAVSPDTARDDSASRSQTVATAGGAAHGRCSPEGAASPRYRCGRRTGRGSRSRRAARSRRSRARGGTPERDRERAARLGLVRQPRPRLVSRRHADRVGTRRRDVRGSPWASPRARGSAIRAPLCRQSVVLARTAKQIAFDAPPRAYVGEQTAIMVARVDGTGVRTLSAVPFRQSAHPSWQPLAMTRGAWRPVQAKPAATRARCILELTGAGERCRGGGHPGR